MYCLFCFGILLYLNWMEHQESSYTAVSYRQAASVFGFFLILCACLQHESMKQSKWQTGTWSRPQRRCSRI